MTAPTGGGGELGTVFINVAPQISGLAKAFLSAGREGAKSFSQGFIEGMKQAPTPPDGSVLGEVIAGKPVGSATKTIAQKAGKEIGGGLTTGINEGMKTAPTSGGGALADVVAGKPVSSATKAAATSTGKEIGGGIAKGVEEAAKTHNMAKVIVPNAEETGRSIGAKIGGGIKSALSSASGDVGGALQGVQDKISGIGTAAQSVGLDISSWKAPVSEAAASADTFDNKIGNVATSAKDVIGIFKDLPGKIGDAAGKATLLAGEVGAAVLAAKALYDQFVQPLEIKIHASGGFGKWWEEHTPGDLSRSLADALGADKSRKFFGNLFGYDPELGHGTPPGPLGLGGGGTFEGGKEFPPGFIGPIPRGSVRTPSMPNIYQQWYGPNAVEPYNPSESQTRGWSGPEPGGAGGGGGGGSSGWRRQESSTTDWDALASAESSGNWSDPDSGGTGHYGGLQFDMPTWRDFGGLEFADRPDHATREQQIIVAERVPMGQRSKRWAETWWTQSSPRGGGGGGGGGGGRGSSRFLPSGGGGGGGGAPGRGGDFGAAAGAPTAAPPNENEIRSWVSENFGIPNTFGTGSWENASHPKDQGWHGKGYAFDFHGTQEQMADLANWVAQNWAGYTLELIYSGPGFDSNNCIKNGKFGSSAYGAALLAEHTDHVHWAMTKAPSQAEMAAATSGRGGSRVNMGGAGAGGGGGGAGGGGGPSGQELGQSIISGMFQELGFPDVFGKPFTQWGAWKMGMGALQYGMGIGNYLTQPGSKFAPPSPSNLPGAAVGAQPGAALMGGPGSGGSVINNFDLSHGLFAGNGAAADINNLISPAGPASSASMPAGGAGGPAGNGAG